jgi:plasmid stability protein
MTKPEDDRICSDHALAIGDIDVVGTGMARLIVRNLDDGLVARLKIRAAEHGRSAEAEHREILRTALAAQPRRSFRELAAKVRSMTAGRNHTPAELLLREGRDEDRLVRNNARPADREI